MLHDEPKLFLGQAEHGGQVHLVRMVEPEALLLTDNFCEGGLVSSKAAVWLDFKRFLLCLYGNLDFTLVIIF